MSRFMNTQVPSSQLDSHPTKMLEVRIFTHKKNVWERERYHKWSGIGFGEKCGTSVIAEIESPLIMENEELIMKLVLENWEEGEKVKKDLENRVRDY